MTPEEQVTKNIGQAFDFAQAVIENPALLDRSAEGEELYILPDDDPELSEANRALRERNDARRLVAA